MSDQEEKEGPLSNVFDQFPDAAGVKFHNSERFAGFDISWTLKGIGFGHLTFSYDKVDKCHRADTEYMDEEMVEKILKLAAPAMAKALVQIDNENPPYSGLKKNE